MPGCALAQSGREGRPPWPHRGKGTSVVAYIRAIAGGVQRERGDAWRGEWRVRDGDLTTVVGDRAVGLAR